MIWLIFWYKFLQFVSVLKRNALSKVLKKSITLAGVLFLDNTSISHSLCFQLCSLCVSMCYICASPSIIYWSLSQHRWVKADYNLDRSPIHHRIFFMLIVSFLIYPFDWHILHSIIVLNKFYYYDLFPEITEDYVCDLMLEQPQLEPLDKVEQEIYSEIFPDVWADVWASTHQDFTHPHSDYLAGCWAHIDM